MTRSLMRASIAAIAIAGCAGACRRATSADDTLVVYNAGSLARPIRAALDTFIAHNGGRAEQENSGSLETARKLTELHKIPDVIALADYELFPRMLIPAHTTWYAQFARNRMVLAYTDRSRFAADVTPQNWWQILQRSGVETGRADPNSDPNGYRTLLTMQLAERVYAQPGLYDRLLALEPARNMRPVEAELVALLQAGELDYIWSYESIAQGASLRYLTLPREIDLSDPDQAGFYAGATTRVRGKAPGDTVVFRGEPIVYGLSIPTNAPHRARAGAFVKWLMSPDGIRVLRANKLDAVEHPVILGSAVPESLIPR
ncbi:MAG: tungstate ABC transporter substrate-binding protein WtpA [Gemmatimonadota bacterium]|nr:tungstate ABC transporter substrate-binding protein WtpA [Gemmatimonadota bacterium]